MSQATTVLYHLTPTGYKVTSYDDEIQPVDELSGGNHPLDSAATLHPDDDHAVPREKLMEYAKAEALELAEKLGIPEGKVSYDADGEKYAFDEFEEFSASVRAP